MSRNEERVKRVAEVISNAPFPSKASLKKAEAAIAASDATIEVTDEMVYAGFQAVFGVPFNANKGWHHEDRDAVRNCIEAALKVMR